MTNDFQHHTRKLDAYSRGLRLDGGVYITYKDVQVSRGMKYDRVNNILVARILVARITSGMYWRMYHNGMPSMRPRYGWTLRY